MTDAEKDVEKKEGQAQAQARQAQQAQGDELERLRGELEALRRQLAEKDEQVKALTDRLKRLQADFENYKKRVEREREEFARLVEDRFLLKILPIYDNMERAFRAYDHNSDKDSFIEGMERIFAQFSDFLRGEGVRPIEALGRPFDPLLHEALLAVETDGPPNVVLEEFERGYLRAERVLRPSRVKVSKRRERAEPPSPLPTQPQAANGRTRASSNGERDGDEDGNGKDGNERKG